jgi:hypothetical protein
MSGFMLALFGTILSSLVTVGSCSAFLQAHEHAIHEVATKEVETTLSEQFTEFAGTNKIRNIEDELRAMYSALPKSRTGKLEPSTVRYAVHRYFVHKFGWYMKGLERSSTFSNSSYTSISKERTPAYIQSIFEQRYHAEGLGLHELAIFVAALSDLVHMEALSDVQKIYTAFKLPTVGSVPRIWADKVVKAYSMHYIMETDMSLSSVKKLSVLEREIPNVYPAWADTSMWIEDFRHTHDIAQHSVRNPFVKHKDSFDDTVNYVQELGHKFGTFQKLECTMLKRQLTDMEYEGTGRVLLSRFYSGGVQGEWTFTESPDYLRNLGVLDESDPKKPSVMIPNYISSSSNCLTGSGFYSVCCSDECEGLLHQVERFVAAPTSSPADIAHVIGNLPSDTVDAPRNMSVTLLRRLDEIAERNGGRVPLHGRLFAQWMHHAYPRECPFPHVTGTVAPLSPTEWMATKGSDVLEASAEEMQFHYDRLEIDQSQSLDLPWNTVEELVAEHQDGKIESASWSLISLRSAMAFILFVSFTMPVFRAYSAVATTSDSKVDSILV